AHETPDEAQVKVQGFRPLPKTRVSPALRRSRLAKHRYGSRMNTTSPVYCNGPTVNRRLAGLHLRSIAFEDVITFEHAKLEISHTNVPHYSFLVLFSLIEGFSYCGPGETPDEAQDKVQGFRPLPKTRVSPALHRSRPKKHRYGSRMNTTSPVYCKGPTINQRLAGLHLRSVGESPVLPALKF
ncbi:hypothetical protein HAX54_015218, partial [Datura stramonium]|nr:hypothetical protein [Datura stramonium]